MFASNVKKPAKNGTAGSVREVTKSNDGKVCFPCMSGLGMLITANPLFVVGVDCGKEIHGRS